MERAQHEKASYAFYTYVFNNYEKFTKPLQKYMTNYHTDDKSHEIVVQNAICKLLSEKIRAQLPTIPQVKQEFNKSMKLLSKQNLDLVEYREKSKKREDKLKAYIKLHYALNDISDGNYELEHASLLMAIYSKVVSLELQPDGKRKHYGKIGKIPALKDSSMYRYLNTARKEAKYNITLNQLSSFKIAELINKLYTSMAIFDYNNDNMTIDQYIGIFEDGTIDTVFNEVMVIDPENDPESYKDFISIIEKNFNAQLINEMHTLENGMKF